MKLTRSREHVINMGQYESVRVGASVELEIDGATDLAPDSPVYEKANVILAQAMKADLDEAIALLPPGSSSYILSWGVKDNA